MSLETENSSESIDPLALEEGVEVNLIDSVPLEQMPKVELSSNNAPEDKGSVKKEEGNEEQATFMFIDDISEYYGHSETVEQTDAILIPPSDKRPFIETEETLPIPAIPESVMVRYSENFPNLNIEKDEEGKEWLENYQASAYMANAGDRFLSRLKKPGSSFKQSIEFQGKRLGVGAVNLSSTPNDKLVGEKAVLWVKSVTGQGGIIQIPLWHSGFWVSIKTPSEISLLELNNRIAEEKIDLGRQTYGLAFSNTMVYSTAHLTNFVIDHIFDHSIKDAGDIRDLISSHDIHLLAWGMACAIWKNGFQYTRSIINEDGSVGRVIKALLAVPKLNFTDGSALTEWQKSHMAGRHGRNMTLESIKKYRNEFTVGHSRTIVLDEERDIKVELSVPYLNRYLDSGQKWINYLVMKVDSAMRITSDDGRRNEYILQYGKASLLRQYAHWVKAVIVKDRVFYDIDTVEQLLDGFSESDSIRKIYFEEIGKFIDDTTVSLIAVPAVKDVDELTKSSRFPYLVPLDPIATFFTLLVLKAQRIQTRS